MAKATDTSITTIDDAPKNPEPTPVQVVRATDLSEDLSGKRVELTINQDSGENGREPVFVGLNGVGYQIPRGVPVNVPVELLEILDNAIQTVYESNGTTAHARDVKRYSYNTRAAA